MNRETKDEIEPFEAEAFPAEPRPLFSNRAIWIFVTVYWSLLFIFVLHMDN